MNRNMVIVECERNLDTLYRILSVIRKRYPELEHMNVREREGRWEVAITLKCGDADCHLIWKKLEAMIGVETTMVYPLQSHENMLLENPQIMIQEVSR